MHNDIRRPRRNCVHFILGGILSRVRIGKPGLLLDYGG